MKAAVLIPIIFLSTVASAQESTFTEFDRYLDISSYTLNEPCLIYNDISYKAQFVLEDRGQDYLYWTLFSGEEIVDAPDNCESVMASVFTDDPSISFVSYDIENLIIVDGDSDTGLRYDVGSRADSSRFDLGFGFDWIRERRVEESVILTGAGSVSFPGPSSFPFEVQTGTDQWIGVSKSFSGTLDYNAETNMFTVTLDSSNEAGDYTLTVRFDGFGSSNSVGLLLIYPIEFHVILNSSLGSDFPNRLSNSSYTKLAKSRVLTS